MHKFLTIVFCLLSITAFSQKYTGKWILAFPITDYITDISTSIKLVQLHLPGDVTIADKQVGLLQGIYNDNYSDTITVGEGRCHLIKGDYYYFTINNKQSGKLPKAGDLLFTLVDKTPVYEGTIIRLASFYIGLKEVYDKPLYDRYAVFNEWTKAKEEKLKDLIVAVIKFTGDYFLKDNPAINEKIKSGKNEGKLVLNTMIACSKQDVIDFLNYMIARPRLYAGQEWKVSEVYATWLNAGSPTIVKN